MQALDAVLARLDSLGQLDEVLGAMRSVAAIRLAEATAALAGARAYADIVGAAMAEALALDGGAVPEPARTAGGLGVLVCGSEHGFVGSYNEGLLAAAGRPDRLFLLGQRAVSAAQEAGLAVEWGEPAATRVDAVPRLARRLGDRLHPAIAAGRLRRLDVVWGQPRPGGGWSVATATVHPQPAGGPTPVARPSPPLHTLPAATLVTGLRQAGLIATLILAATEALAAENAARVLAVSQAHDNVVRTVEDLRVQEWALRQEAITAELLEVTTGAEALAARGGAGAR